MKIFFRIVFVLYVFFLGGTESFAQITINNTLYTPTQLVDGVLVPSTSGTIISNVQFRGVYNSSNRYQVGYFSTATTTLAQLGFSNGIVLSTGNTSTIPLALGSNPRATQMATAYTSGTPGELRQTGTPAPPIIQDLDVLAGASNYFNGAILEFDFIPVENSVSFRYVFGSEEYSDNSGSINYQCSNYNDKFGFLISGPGISGGQGFSNDARNIARLGNGSEVSINSVNSGVVGSSGGAPSASNCLAANASWVQNTPTPEFLGTIDGTQLNGNTRILTATQTGLTPGQTYHIKLIITDVGDATYDSVVYLEAGSFTTEFSCDAGANQSLCDVTSTTLAAVSPATGTWSVVSGSGTFVSNTDPNTIVNGLAPGANVLRWTASDLSCFSEVTINVNLSPAVPTITTTPADCSSAGVSTISNYNASNTYTFSPVGPTVGVGGVVSGMTVGTIYTVTASLSGCTSASSATFSIDPQLPPTTPTISTTAPTCSSAGVSTITNYSASNIYTFTPVGPTVGAGGVISGMTVGTSYTVTADNGICLTPQSASFSNAAQLPTPAVPTITTTPADCSSAGVSTITNYNASNTYTFSPVGPTVGAGGVVSGMTVGTIYTVTASLSGCTSASSATFSIDPQLPPTTPIISTTAPTCSSAGVSTITNYSASNIYTFTPVGPTVGAGGVISGMTVGTSYTVTADNGICLTPQSASFSNAAQLPTPAVPTITTTPADCSSAGVSTITNYNASNTYTFSPVGPTVGAGGVVSGMTVGTIYTVTASLSGCTSAASATFSIDPQLPPTTPIISTTAPTCSSAGVSTITNYSASNIYTFTPVGPTVGVGGVISGMTVGTSYTVTADNGICLTPQSASFSNAAQLPTPAVPTITTTPADCSSAGVSTITNYNASNTYTFSPVGPTVGAGGVVSGMTVGTIYTVTASLSGCTSAASATFSIDPQLPPTTPTISTTAPTCSSAGVSTITNYSASNIYTFTPVGPTVGAGGLISGMTVGTSYTVTADNGICLTPQSASFSNAAQLPTPAVPTITSVAATCSASGSSTISNYNASNTYTFSPVGPTVGAGGVISGMTFGTSYTVTATNGGCTSLASASFSNDAQLPTPTVPTITTTPADCSSAGSSTISNYNASNTYTFSPVGPTVGAGGLISGMTVGTSYTVTATDGGCTSAASASFSNAAQLPTPAVPTITSVAADCSASGSSTISNYNASNTYTFTPVGPTVGAGGLISGMTVGTSYTVTATDGGCTSPASASFSNDAQLPTPAVPTITSVAADCSAAGSSTISNYIASNTYTFTPVGPTVGAGGLISGMTFGTSYTVTATNGGCTSAASASFSNAAQLPTPAVPTITSVAATCSSAGSSTISNYSASNTYTFSPVGPTVGAGGVISGMTVGTSYTVTATNGGCISLASASFSNAAQLPTPAVPTITSVAATCSAAGSSTISNYSASNTYTFTPVGPTVGAGGLISGMTFGTSYTVTATNGGCTSAASASFSNDAQLESPSVSITHGCNGLDYELIASETINATYQWFDGNGNLIGSSPIIVIDNSDTYEVQVTLNGCMTNEYVTINNSFCSIPKGISPNNDGDNDSWDLSNLNIKKAQIFNRYGVEVYTKDNYTNEWEGRTNSGDELPTATYYYVLTFSNGTVKTGWVYLNRVN